MLDNTHSFFIVKGCANCFGTVQVMFVVLIFFVVFECISSNIVKRDIALSSGEVRIVFFWYTLSLFTRNFKPRLVMPKFQASVSVYHAAKLPPLQPAPSQPAPCYPKITTRAKTPSSCQIPTHEIPLLTLSRKGR